MYLYTRAPCGANKGVAFYCVTRGGPGGGGCIRMDVSIEHGFNVILKVWDMEAQAIPSIVKEILGCLITRPAD